MGVNQRARCAVHRGEDHRALRPQLRRCEPARAHLLPTKLHVAWSAGVAEPKPCGAETPGGLEGAAAVGEELEHELPVRPERRGRELQRPGVEAHGGLLRRRADKGEEEVEALLRLMEVAIAEETGFQVRLLIKPWPAVSAV